MKSVIHIENLAKSFGNIAALNKISLSVEVGEIFGVIGPDGAGKTTLFRILTTLLTPDSGNACVLGYDVVKDYKQLRPLLGYMPGRFSLYQDLSVEENIRFFASVFGTTLEENYDLVEPIYSQIEPFKDRLAGDLSGGMKQKLALSCALIHKPRLLVLDEPTTGVDAVSRKEFWEMLKLLRQEKISIIVSTPYMDEARQCDRVALMQEGKILKSDTPSAIIGSYSRTLLGIKAGNRFRLIRTLHRYPHTQSAHPFGEFIHYTDQRSETDITELKEFLHREGVTDAVIQPIQPGIEDTFMDLMQG